MPTVTRTEKLDLRLTPSAKRVLQSAATAAQRSVSEFVLESALPAPRRRCRTAGVSASTPSVGRHSKPRSMHRRVLLKDVRAILKQR